MLNVFQKLPIKQKPFFTSKKTSVFNKITFISACILLITFCIVTIATEHARRSFEREITSVGAKTLEFYTMNLDANIAVVEDYSANVMLLASVQTPLKTLSAHSTKQLSASVALIEALRENPTYIDAITNHAILDLNGNTYSANVGIRSLELSKKTIYEIYAQYGACYWTKDFATNHKILLCRTINTVRNSFTYVPIGILCIEVDLETLTNSHLVQDNFYNSNLFLTNADGEVLYCTDTLGSNLADVQKTIESNTFAQDNIIISHTLENADWTVSLAIPRATLFKNINAIAFLQNICFVILFILVIILNSYSAYRITSPLTFLHAEMEKVSHGNLAINEALLLEQIEEDEIGDICLQFIDSTKHLAALIDENYKFELLRKDAQIKALQSQINPHFIYNALDSVNWLAKLHKQNDIAHIAQALSRLLRNAMNQVEIESSLQNELNLIHDYIYIQNLRFGDRLCFKEDIDDSMLHIKTPKLILQPLVENAMKYCVEKSNETSTISLHISDVDGSCLIQVSDDGNGIETLPDGLVSTKLLRPSGTGIGLANVEQRLHLLYGKDAKMEIYNYKGIGLMVSLYLPQGKELPLAETCSFG